MPIALEPDQKFPVVLDCDKDKPKETRPTFFVKSLSMREQRKLAEDMNASFDGSTDDICNQTCELVRRYVVGWINMGPHVYPTADLQEFLSVQEARELLRKVMANSYVQEEEKKS